MVGALLTAKLMRTRSHYAPMDKASLAKNRILRYIGLFPVDIRSARRAEEFIQATSSILLGRGVLWMTPQGRFADTRETTLVFKSGLASAASRAAMEQGKCTLIPFATEYPFWNERLPYALLHFGQPIHVVEGVSKPALTRELEQALQQTMEELKTQSLTRNPANFTRLPLWRKVS